MALEIFMDVMMTVYLILNDRIQIIFSIFFVLVVHNIGFHLRRYRLLDLTKHELNLLPLRPPLVFKSVLHRYLHLILAH